MGYVILAADFQLKIGLQAPNHLMVVVGEGSKRCEYIVDNIKLIIWLLDLREAIDFEEAASLGIKSLELSGEDVRSLIIELVDNDVLKVVGNMVNEIPVHEDQWERWAWRDALDFHRATRNLLWRHDYSSKPEVMTWFYNDVLIMPNEPKPKHGKQFVKGVQIRLPTAVEPIPSISFHDTLVSRRTFRHFIGKEISQEELSTILSRSFADIGMYKNNPYKLIHTYSTGSFFEVYFVASYVRGLEKGLYHYNSTSNLITQIRVGDYDDQVVKMTNNQDYIRKASFVVYFTISWLPYQWKFRYSRAYRLALIELSGAVQNLLLTATALGFKTFQTPAINDCKVADFLQIEDDLNESPMYVVGIGKL